MEQKTFVANLSVGDSVEVYKPDYELCTGHPHPLSGLSGKITKVIFPGEILYEAWGLANGTGGVKYRVELDKPRHGTTGYLFSENELRVISK